MDDTLNEMYSNINYFYKITSSMHSHKNYNEQTQLVDGIISNMTTLSSDIDSIKGNMDELEKSLYKRADEKLYENDKYIDLPDTQKN